MGDGRWGVSMRRYTLAGFATLGTRQSRAVEVAGERATVDATRSFVAASRHAEVEAPGSGAVDASAYRVADPSYLIPGMRRFSLSRFSRPGTQVRQVSVGIAEATVDATRTPFVAADRNAAIAAAGGYQSGKSYALPDVSGGVSATFEEVYPV